MPCALHAGYGSFNDQTGVLVDGRCRPVGGGTGGGSGGGDSSSSAPAPVTKTVNCGRPRASRADVHDSWNIAECGANEKACLLADPATGKPKPVDAVGLLQQDPATKAWTLQSVWCPANSTPVPDLNTIYDEVVKLLPAVPIAAVPPNHRTLVNIQTIVWAQTAADRDLGTVRVVGLPVHLRLHFDHGDWVFGDGSTDTAHTPGQPFTQADYCNTAQCPGFYGHTYTSTGRMTLELAVSWTAEYSLDGAHWNPVSGAALQGPRTSAALTVLQARSELVPVN